MLSGVIPDKRITPGFNTLQAVIYSLPDFSLIKFLVNLTVFNFRQFAVVKTIKG